MRSCVCLPAVTAVRLTQAGAPLVVLSNRHAYTYVEALRVWARVADDSFPASPFASSLSAQQGERGPSWMLALFSPEKRAAHTRRMIKDS